jgi:hypothetical protein
MTIIVEHRAPAGPPPAVFSGPSRWVAAALVVVGAALQAVEFLLEPIADPEPAARVAWWLAHPERIELSKLAGFLAVPFLVGGFAVMVAMTRRHSRRLAAAAAVMLTAAMVGLAAVQGMELGALGAARAGSPEAAEIVLDAADLGLPGAAMMLVFLGGALSGTILLNISLWRSPYVPRLVVVFGVGFIVLDLVLGMGVAGHLAALVSGVTLAWAIVTGYARAPRQPRRKRAH